MRKHYVGVCYDGPCEGEQLSSWCRRILVPVMSGYNRDRQPVVGSYSYRWSEPLRKWVYVQ